MNNRGGKFLSQSYTPLKAHHRKRHSQSGFHPYARQDLTQSHLYSSPLPVVTPSSTPLKSSKDEATKDKKEKQIQLPPTKKDKEEKQTQLPAIKSDKKDKEEKQTQPPAIKNDKKDKEEKQTQLKTVSTNVLAAPEPHRHQDIFISQVNLYLELAKKPKISTEGQCHGLLWTWVEKMHDNDEEGFYTTYTKITDCKAEELLNIKTDLEDFLNKVDKKQRPENYNPSYHQREVYKILNLTHLKSIDSKEFKQEDLAKLITDYSQDGNTIGIIGEVGKKPNGKAKKHSIGIFYHNKEYLLYDANYKTMRARKFNDAKGAVSETWQRLREPFDLPKRDKINLEIDIVGKKVPTPASSSSSSSSSLFKPIDPPPAFFSKKPAIKTDKPLRPKPILVPP